jgi:hypothetical protein
MILFTLKIHNADRMQHVEIRQVVKTYRIIPDPLNHWRYGDTAL